MTRISQDYTKMTTDGIRTFARNEPPTYKALKSRQSISVGKTLVTTRPLKSLWQNRIFVCVIASAIFLYVLLLTTAIDEVFYVLRFCSLVIFTPLSQGLHSQCEHEFQR